MRWWLGQFGKIVPPTIHHLPNYPSAGLRRGVEPIPAASRCWELPICLPPNLPRQFLTCFYLLQAVAAEVEQLQVFARQELLGLQVCDAVPRQVHLDDVNRQPGRDVVQIYKKKKKTDGMSKHKMSFLQRSYMGRKWWHSKTKKWPPRASGETRGSVCSLRGFQDVLWVVATVNVFKTKRRVTTWTLIFPPDGSHGACLPRMAFEALMYKPVSSTYSPTDDGRSRDFRLQTVTRSLTITWSFVVWHVFDNKLQ